MYLPDNFIHNLFVHPHYQNKQIGSKLLQIAETQLNHPMTLKIAVANEKVCYFYEKHGWHHVSTYNNEIEPYHLYSKY